MTYKKFKEIIDTLREVSDRNRILYKHKVDLIEFESEFHFIINTLLKEQFGKEGYDWIQWFCFEKDFGRAKDMKAWDENKNEICKDIKGLYQLVNKQETFKWDGKLPEDFYTNRAKYFVKIELKDE